MAYWPGLDHSPAVEENVIIACGAKLAGYKVQDFDVILCAKFRSGRRFVPTRPLHDQNDAVILPQPVAVQNLLVAVEVKDHDASRISVKSENIFVCYIRGGEHWHDATKQNIEQVHALKLYYKDQNIELYVHRLLIMRGLEKSSVDGVLPRTFRAQEFLTELASLSRVYRTGAGLSISSGSNKSIDQAGLAPIYRELRPTTLDRQRMDRIARKRGLSAPWFEIIGQKLLGLRGRGGTGKTVLLLQSAFRAYDEQGERSLLLTYNLALVADIRRTMALMNIPGSAPESGITVDSVMSFLFAWLFRLGLVTEEETDRLDGYSELCKTAIEMMRSDAISSADIITVKENYPERFSFDFIMADEGQDWPQDEADILKFLYGSSHIVAADGIDQMIRGQRCDWFKGVGDHSRKLVKLHRCLRMKANLASFANAIAEEAKIAWGTEANPDAVGGRVILIPGSYAAQERLNVSLIKEANEAGNELIDFLVCVPSSDVAHCETGRKSKLGMTLATRGLHIWDATDRDIRKDFPRGIDTLRIVHYASCRGLEGWTVIAEGLDSYWLDCFRQKLMKGESEDLDPFRSPEDIARLDAWHQVLIPLTRSIDTLVITLSDPGSEVARKITKVARNFPDFVELP